jgi:hypothetical protein
VPRFHDYLVEETWQGPNAPVKLKTHAQRMFRTILTGASKERANFAGHYRFEIWGCGTECNAGALIDLQTGDVFPPPLAGKGSGWEYWIISPSMFEASGIDFHANSRLMILRCGYERDRRGNNIPDVFYFVWDGQHFAEVLRDPARKSH